jgi:hypothetical protein
MPSDSKIGFKSLSNFVIFFARDINFLKEFEELKEHLERMK